MKILMKTDYRHFFKAGDELSVPEDIDKEKANQLIDLGRAQIIKQDDTPDEDWTVVEIREWLKQNDLKVSGNKNELLERVNANS